MPSPTQTHASSDALLVITVMGMLEEPANEGEANAALSPKGAFILAAGKRDDMA